MRMQMRRFTRLTNAFSKKIDNLGHAVALHFMHYNFCRVHQTLRVTPAMEAGLTDHVWGIEEIVDLLCIFTRKTFWYPLQPTQRSKGETWKLTNSLECKNCKEQGRIFILLSDHFPDLGQHTANRSELDRFSALFLVQRVRMQIF